MIFEKDYTTLKTLPDEILKELVKSSIRLCKVGLLCKLLDIIKERENEENTET